MSRSLLILVVCTLCLLSAACEQEVTAQAKSGSDLIASESASELSAQPAKPKQSLLKPQPAESEKAPKITFEEVVHDYGEVGPGSKNTCEFRFANTGEGLLKIGKIRATCGCTVPTLQKKEYKPGESGTIKVKYRAEKRASTIKKLLHVRSNDKGNPDVVLTIKARVVQKVVHNPEKLNLSLKQQNAGCPEITLKSVDGKAFAITRFTSPLNCIAADIDPTARATDFTIPPKVNINKLSKTLNGLVIISLTHPQCPTVIIPYDVLAEFKLDPPSINILNAEAAKPVKRKLWVLNNYNEKFEIESTSSKQGFVKVVSQKKLGSRAELELEITPPAAAGNRTFSDVFFISIKNGEKLRVTCRGFYARKRRGR